MHEAHIAQASALPTAHAHGAHMPPLTPSAYHFKCCHLLVQGLDIRTADPSCYCQKALAKGWNFLMKRVDLGWEGISCAAYCASNACPGGTGACNAAVGDVCNKLA